MSNIFYHYMRPPGIRSRMLQFFMGLFRMKSLIEKKIENNGFRKEPARILNSILKNYEVQVEEIKGKCVWEISHRESESDPVIFYLHGGAYYAGITHQHWKFVKQLLDKTGARIIIPDYPLAPESTCEEVYRFLDEVYSKLVSDHSSTRIIFMGDSAGGGLALGFAQHLRNKSLTQPSEIILFSPWLDASMSNPAVVEFEKDDKLLSVKGLKVAGSNYAGQLGVADYRVSPLFGEFTNLGRISIFIGTHDLLIADVRKLREILEARNMMVNYFEYPGMFHDWVLFPNLKETEDVFVRLAALFKSFPGQEK